jgi:hypothetical protein
MWLPTKPLSRFEKLIIDESNSLDGAAGAIDARAPLQTRIEALLKRP